MKELYHNYLEATAQPQSDYALNHFVDGSPLTVARRFRQSVIEYDNARAIVDTAQYHIDKARIKLRILKGKALKAEGDKRLLLRMKAAYKETQLERAERSLGGKMCELETHAANVVKYAKQFGVGEHTPPAIIKDMLELAEGDHYLLKLALDTAVHVMASAQGAPPPGVLLALSQFPETELLQFKSVVTELMESLSAGKYMEELRTPEGVPSLKEKINRNPMLHNKSRY